MSAESRLTELGLILPPVPKPGGIYKPVVQVGQLIYVSGHGPMRTDGSLITGKVGLDLTEEQVLGRIEQSRVWLWEDPVGTPVHLTQATPPSFGVVRIGPVYTPDEHRGQGYATAMVAALSRELAAAGVRVCLFTDQANPTSNAIYQRIGYVPVIDMVNLLVEPR